MLAFGSVLVVVFSILVVQTIVKKGPLTFLTLGEKYEGQIDAIFSPNNNGVYTGDEIATDFSKLDLAEQEQSVLNASDELTETKRRIVKEQKEKAANDKEKAEKQEKELKELREKLALNP